MSSELFPQSSLIKQGYLMKESMHLKQYRKRWVVLKGFCVYSFKAQPVDHRTNDSTEIYDLSTYCVIKQISSSHPDPSTEGLFEFELNAPSIDLHRKFRADSYSEMLEWITRIKKQINKVQIMNETETKTRQCLSEDASVSISKLVDGGFNAEEIQFVLLSEANENEQMPFDPRSMFDIDETTKTTQQEKEQKIDSKETEKKRVNTETKLIEMKQIHAQKEIEKEKQKCWICQSCNGVNNLIESLKNNCKCCVCSSDSYHPDIEIIISDYWDTPTVRVYDTKWICSLCTLKNDLSKKRCAACKHDRNDTNQPHITDIPVISSTL